MTLTTQRPKRQRLAAFVTLPTLGFLAACGDYNTANDNLNNARGDIARMGPGLSQIQDSGRPTNVNVERGLFLADQGFRSGRGNPLPARFETASGVTINTSSPINIEEFSQIVEELTGIRVDYEDIRMGAGQNSSAAPADTENPNSVDAVGALLSRAQGTTTNAVDRTFRIRHTGKLSSVLDTVASRLSADWAYEGGRIVFKGPQTMTYTIWAQPAETTTSSTVGGGSDAFGSGAAASTTTSLSNNYWESIEQGIAGLMPENARYSINRSSGTVTVTGTTSVHLRVQDFIENENRRLSRQVAVKLDVIAFTQNRSDNVSVSLETLLSQVGDGLGYSAGNLVDRGAGGSISAGVSGNRGNATATVNALSSLGQVSIVQSQSVVAMNNTSTPISITSEQAYAASVAVTGGGEGEEPLTTITPGIINSGINFVVTPRIMSSNDVLLNYTLNISELIGIEDFTSGGSSVQLPQMTSRNFMQSVNIRSGDTVIIASSQQQNTNQTRSGPFDPRFWGFGGSRGYNIDNTQILILMTPVVVEASNTPRARR